MFREYSRGSVHYQRHSRGEKDPLAVGREHLIDCYKRSSIIIIIMASNPITISSSSPIHPFVSISPKSGSLTRDLHRQSSFGALPNVRQPKVLHPIENEDLRILLLENISLDAVKTFKSNGWRVDHHAKAMNEDDLIQRIGQYHAIGIRSKTKITERVIKAASKVYTITHTIRR